MQVEKGVAGRYARSRSRTSMACDNMLFTKKIDEWLTYIDGVDKRINAGDWLTKVHLPPSGLPSLQCIEAVGQGYARFEWIENTGEGSAQNILDQLRVDDDFVQSAAGALACMDVKGAKVGDNIDEEFIRKREEVRGRHCEEYCDDIRAGSSSSLS